MNDIISLYRNYVKYDNLTDDDLQYFLKPSIQLNQSKKHYYNNELVGFTNWAYLSNEASIKFKTSGTIDCKNWNSGDNLWHVETICTSHLNDIISWTKNYFAKKFENGKAINWLRTDNTKIYRTAKRTTKDNWLWVQ